MTHPQLIDRAVTWLRSYRCSIVLSEQACASGEMPDAIGWKGNSHSVVVECKVSRSDFLADSEKPFRKNPESGLGCERFYLAPRGLLRAEELPVGWGLLECHRRAVQVTKRSAKNLRSAQGMGYEMNLLLASLRRVEVRIEPQTITNFLKWKNRLTEYNGGSLPAGVGSTSDEGNSYLLSGSESVTSEA